MNTKEVIGVDLVKAYQYSEYQEKSWSLKDVEKALERYKKFLILAAKNKNIPLAPTRDIDIMWHLHMLNPKVYHDDCMKLFGEIFDHDGGFGKEDGELPILKNTFNKTSELWLYEYGACYFTANETDAEGVINCWHDCQSRCWHACKTAVNQQVIST